MSFCHSPISFCICDCHKPWLSTVPPVCTCHCGWPNVQTAVTVPFVDTLGLCKHLRPVMFGCEECAKEEKEKVSEECSNDFSKTMPMPGDDVIDSLISRVNNLENSEIQHFKNYKKWINNLDEKIDKLQQSREAHTRNHTTIFEKLDELKDYIGNMPNKAGIESLWERVQQLVDLTPKLFEAVNRIEKLESILNSMDGIKEIWAAINELRGMNPYSKIPHNFCHNCGIRNE